VGESAAKARATTRRSERTQRLDSGPIGCGQQAAPAGRGAMLAEPRCGRGAPCGILALRIINHYLPWALRLLRWRHTWLGALDGRADTGCRILGRSITHSHTRAHIT
jgi:hypothetical protein